MSKSLLIVESPAKAKTITKYLGSDYIVASSYGHITDLPKNNKAIDIENNFEVSYEISKEKEKVVSELKKLKKQVNQVLLATDEDREGEAISWHLCNVLDLDINTTKRVTYTEITQKAIVNAVNNPRSLNMDLVNAQQARRVLDRLVGFGISPVLWRKVKPNLSAGRVQSVAVRLIVDRERQINSFNSKSNFRLSGFFDILDKNNKTVILKADSSDDIMNHEKALPIVESFKGATYKISKIEKKESKKSPSAPFTTSTLQQEASKKFGFSVSKTMKVAQSLYEAGHITYMRTDSVNMSKDSMENCKKVIIANYGKEYYNIPRIYQSKIANAQEAHEAIRPTDFEIQNLDIDIDEQKLYSLIWKRALSSQMADAKTENTIISINNNNNDITLNSKQELITFDGFLKLYQVEKDDDDEKESSTLFLPSLKVNDELLLNKLECVEKFSKHPPRYNEASLVKKLEELGIGRPSTYVPTISTIQNRNYVVKESREGVLQNYQLIELCKDNVTTKQLSQTTGTEKNKLFPTDIGILVTDFLVLHFNNIIDFNFTAQVEEKFDKISHGSLDWKQMLKSFYDPFKIEVEVTSETAERVSGERILGNHPATNEVVLVRMGKFGPMAQIGTLDKENPDFKPKYARLRKGQTIETITLEESLELFKLPRTLGMFEEKEIKVNIGRFGPYIQHNSAFISLKKEDDPFEIDLDLCIIRIQEKRTADANKIIKIFEEEDIHILNGRWGPYIKHNKENYKIPKTEDASKLDVNKCLELINEQQTKPKKTFKKIVKK